MQCDVGGVPGACESVAVGTEAWDVHPTLAGPPDLGPAVSGDEAGPSDEVRVPDSLRRDVGAALLADHAAHAARAPLETLGSVHVRLHEGATALT